MSDVPNKNVFSSPEGFGGRKGKSPDINSAYVDSAGHKSLKVGNGAFCSDAKGLLHNVVASGYKVTEWDWDGNPAATSASLLLSSDASTIISGATALDGAAIAVANGAHLYNGYAGSNASVDAVQGGIISGVDVTSGGAAAAAVLTSDADGNNPLGNKNVGGTIFDPLVHSGGYILAGGGGPGFTVKGFNVAGSGGLVSGGTYEDGSEMAVGRGGTSLGGVFAGTQYVQSTGVTSGNVFKGSGATQIVNGGLASRSTALDGAQVFVSGGRGSELVAGQGGTVLVAGGTYASILTSDHSTILGNYTSGFSYGNTVLSGGTEIVGSDGFATSSVVTSGGKDIIASGGTAVLTNVSGGVAEVSAGGYMSAGSAAQGGTIAISGGGTGISIAADSGGYVDVQSAASAYDIIANSSGHVIIEGGATVSGATANSGGLFDVQSGGSVEWGLQVNGGSANINNGANVDELIVSGGSAEIYSGGNVGGFVVTGGTQAPGGPIVQGTVQIDQGASFGYNYNEFYPNGSSVTAGPGGVVVVGSGAEVSNINAVGAGYPSREGAGGTVILHGNVDHAVATSGGVVSAGEGASVGDISFAGASAYIGSGATVGDPSSGEVLVDNHGTQTSVPHGTLVASGAYAFEPGYLNNGYFYLDTEPGYLNIENGAVVDAVSAGNNGLVDIAGAVASADAGANGRVNFNGGEAASATAESSGIVQINDNSFVSSLSAYDGGSALVNSGGRLDMMTIDNNGHGTIQAGATVTSVHVGGGGSALFLSGASALSITVASGGWVSGPTVTDNNILTVESGGTATGAVITAGRNDAKANPGGGKEHPTTIDNSGGETVVASGATLNSTYILGATSAGGAGGLLVVESGAVLQNTSMGSNARIKVEGLRYNDQHKQVIFQGGVLYVTEGTGADAQSWSIPLLGGYNPNDFTLVDDGSGNTVLVYACFLAGAMIRLENGEVPVEDIKAGDRICVLDNGQPQIREVRSVIHKRAVVRKDLPEELAGWPVQICKDAFAPNVPSQDLFVTPEHSFYLNGRFVPVRMLVNGATIRYDLSQDSYEYYHVQTDPHAIIWANNTLTESYLETGLRQGFEEQGSKVARLVRLRDLTWADDAAAPLDISRAFVEPLYNEFRDRAYALGFGKESVEPAKQNLTEDADLRLMLDDGTIVRNCRQSHGKMIFALPHRTRTVRLLSRSFRPSSTIGAYVDDRRDLGVLVGKIEFWTGGREIDVTSHLEGKDLPGWSVIEAGPHRWTTGNALLPLPECVVADGEKSLLSLQIEAGGPYPLYSSMPENDVALSA